MPDPATSGSRSGITFIPPKKMVPARKVLINNTDVSNKLILCTITPSVTEAVWSIDLTLDNGEGQYTKEFVKGDIIKAYIDYDSATTQLFEGRIDTINYILSGDQGYTCDIRGRGYGAEALDKNVNKQYDTATALSTIFKEVRNEYLPNHSTDDSQIDTISNTDTPAWSGVPVWQVFQDIIVAAKEKTGDTYHFYCDYNKIWHLFKEGDRISQTEAAVVEDNIVSMNVSDDLTTVKNRIMIYGREINGIPVVETSENTDSQSLYWVKELSTSDSNLVTREQVKNKADALLSKYLTPEQKGSVRCVGLPNILPGQQIYIMNPYCDVMGLRTIVGITHTLTSNGFFTTLDFQETEKGLVHLFEERKKREQELSAIANRYGMEHTHIVDFSKIETSDLDEAVRTIIWDDNLMLELEETSGYIVTEKHTANKNITKCVLKVSGQNLASDEGKDWVIGKVSVDNEASWEDLTIDSLHTVIGTGKILKIKLKLISLTTKITAVGVLYI